MKNNPTTNKTFIFTVQSDPFYDKERTVKVKKNSEYCKRFNVSINTNDDNDSELELVFIFVYYILLNNLIQDEISIV